MLLSLIPKSSFIRNGSKIHSYLRLCTNSTIVYYRALEGRLATRKNRLKAKPGQGGVTRNRPAKSEEDMWLEGGAYDNVYPEKTDEAASGAADKPKSPSSSE
jgi:hypothetical protein